jgi:hypothetical protein
MKLLIAGSRTLSPSVAFIYGAVESFRLPKLKEVVSGAANGVDSAGEDFADYYDIEIRRFYPDWDGLGKSAGYKRNLEMGQYADALLLIWDGESKGSGHMKDIMRKLNKPIYEIVIKGG